VSIQLVQNTFFEGRMDHLSSMVADISVGLHLFSKQKNDYKLLPFVSGKDGKIIITSTDIEHEISETTKWGRMDYSISLDCFSFVEIYFPISAEIQTWIAFLETVPEKEKQMHARFSNHRELLEVLKKLKNASLPKYSRIPYHTIIRDEWDDESEREYTMLYPGKLTLP